MTTDAEPDLGALDRARGWILAIGVSYLILVVLITIALGDLAVTGDVRAALLGLAAIQLGLWWWAKRAPFPAAVIALVAFVAPNLYQAVVDPEGLRWMIVVRIIFLLGLIKAVHAGVLARRAGRLPAAMLVKR